MFEILPFLALLLLVAFASLRHPPVAVGLILSSFALEQWAMGNSAFFVDNPAFANIACGAVALLALVVKTVRSGHSGTPVTRVHLLVALLLSYAIGSCLWSWNPDMALATWGARFPYFVLGAIVCPLLIRSVEDLRLAFRSFLALGCVVALLLAFDTEWTDTEAKQVVFASTGVLGKDRGNYLETGTFCGYLLLAAVMVPAKDFLPGVRWVRLPMLLGVLLLSIQFGARGQVIALLPAAVAGALITRRYSGHGSLGRLLLMFVASMCILMLCWEVLFPLGSRRWDPEQMAREYQAGRVNTSVRVLDAWWMEGGGRLLFGLGSMGSYNPKVLGFYPHFVPVEVLCDYGLVGLLLYVGLIGSVVVRLLSARATGAIHPSQGVYVGLVGALWVYELLLSLKSGTFLGCSSTLLFTLVIASVARKAPRTVSLANAKLRAGQFSGPGNDNRFIRCSGC